MSRKTLLFKSADPHFKFAAILLKKIINRIYWNKNINSINRICIQEDVGPVFRKLWKFYYTYLLITVMLLIFLENQKVYSMKIFSKKDSSETVAVLSFWPRFQVY